MAFFPFSNFQDAQFLAFRSKKILACKSIGALLLHGFFTCHGSTSYPIWALSEFIFSLKLSFDSVLNTLTTWPCNCNLTLYSSSLSSLVTLCHFLVIGWLLWPTLTRFDWYWLMLTFAILCPCCLTTKHSPPPNPVSILGHCKSMSKDKDGIFANWWRICFVKVIDFWVLDFLVI